MLFYFQKYQITTKIKIPLICIYALGVYLSNLIYKTRNKALNICIVEVKQMLKLFWT